MEGRSECLQGIGQGGAEYCDPGLAGAGNSVPPVLNSLRAFFVTFFFSFFLSSLSVLSFLFIFIFFILSTRWILLPPAVSSRIRAYQWGKQGGACLVVPSQHGHAMCMDVLDHGGGPKQQRAGTDVIRRPGAELVVGEEDW